MPESSEISVDRRDAVALVSLHNPPLNLLTMDVRAQLSAAVESIRRDTEIRAVVIASALDRAFSVGSDIREIALLAADREAALARAHEEHATLAKLAALSQPVIAAIDGPALGGGLELALACDLRVAAEDARLGLPEVQIGLFPSGGGTQRLPRLIGVSRAKALMYTGDTVTGAEGHAIGLVDRLAAPGCARTVALELASTLAARPSTAVKAIKRATDTGLAEGMDVGLLLEEELIADLHASRDAQEGIAAFFDKREPRFTHS